MLSSGLDVNVCLRPNNDVSMTTLFVTMILVNGQDLIYLYHTEMRGFVKILLQP